MGNDAAHWHPGLAAGGDPAPGHYEHAHLLSNVEKLILPILGSMLPFGPESLEPTGDLVFQNFGSHQQKGWRFG